MKVRVLAFVSVLAWGTASAQVAPVAANDDPLPILEDPHFAVATFDRELQDISHRTVEKTFTFPDKGDRYSSVNLRYALNCPEGGCDPWDRKGTIYVRTENDETVEIGRIITPYNKSCEWNVDVTDFQGLLHGEVTLGIFIDTWVGSGTGWLVSADFNFEKGEPERMPIEVVNLWEGNPEIGKYTDYFEGRTVNTEFFKEITFDIPRGTDGMKLRFNMTGHGQGNTCNAAEFCRLQHTAFVDGGEVAHHVLWRDDCRWNPCSPQGGTWTYDRAGWCPGDVAESWEVDVSHRITPGAPMRVDYEVQEYINYCSPSNPECDPELHCVAWVDDCNYDGGGHTTPHIWVESQAIYYDTDGEAPCNLDIEWMDFPDTMSVADTISVPVRVSNDCEEMFTLDRAVLRVTGLAGLHRTLYQGPAVSVGPGESVESTIDQVIPGATPVGRYAVSAILYRNGEPLDSHTSMLEVIAALP